MELNYKQPCSRCEEWEYGELLTINGECDTCHNDK